MADYLTNLLNRHLAVTEVVKPRLPALYESASVPDSYPEVFVDPQNAGYQDVSRGIRPAQNHHDHSIKKPDPHSIPEAGQESAPTREVQRALHKGKTRVTRSSLPASAQTAQGSPDSRKKPPSGVQEMRPATAQHKLGIDSNRDKIDLPIQPSRAVPSVTRITEPEEAVPQALKPLRVPIREHPDGAPYQVRARSPDNEKPALTEGLPTTTPFSSDRRQPPAVPIRSSPPVVRITIGRIEVRAFFPQQAASPRQPQVETGPALSLEAYMNKRNGGS